MRLPIVCLTEIATAILAQRDAGIPLTIPLVSCIAAPIIERNGGKGKKWKPSKSWCTPYDFFFFFFFSVYLVFCKHLHVFLSVFMFRYWHFMKRIHLTWKKGTRDRRKLPPNVEDIKFNFTLRLIWLVSKHSVHPKLCINMDETGQNLFPSKNLTWLVFPLCLLTALT
jgi:hypothetical protein